MPALQVASVRVKPMDVLGLRLSGILLQWVRFDLEHFRDRGCLPYLQTSMEMDGMHALLEMGAARGLV